MPQRPVRLLALVWAVLQLALPLGALFADAHVAAEGAKVVAHIESTTTDGCRPAHAEDCVVCRTLGEMHGAVPLPPICPAPLPRGAPVAAVRESAPPAAERALILPRGPPAV